MKEKTHSMPLQNGQSRGGSARPPHSAVAFQELASRNPQVPTGISKEYRSETTIQVGSNNP